MSYYFDINIPKVDGSTFKGVRPGDIVMVPSDSNSRIFIGSKSNNAAAIMLDSNVTVFGNMTFSNPTNAIKLQQSNNTLSIQGNLNASTYCNLPIASTSTQGIVSLVDSFSSASVSNAPTANALSNLYSWVVGQNYGQGGGGGTVTTNSNNYWNVSGCNVYIAGPSNLGIRTIPTTPLDVLGDATIRGILSASNISYINSNVYPPVFMTSNILQYNNVTFTASNTITLCLG